MLDELYQISAADDPQRPVWEFLMRLADCYPEQRDDINAFLTATVTTAGTLATVRDQLDRERQFVLSINFTPQESDEPAIAAVDARLVVEGTATALKTFAVQTVTSWATADVRTAAIIRECRDIVMQQYRRDEAALLVEFLMPAAFIERTPEDLPVRAGGAMRPLAGLHPVVVRLRERIAQRGDAINLEEWELVASRIDRERPGRVQWMDQTRRSPTIDDCNGLVALRFLPTDDLIEIVSEGFPFMAWLRSEPSGGDWAAFEQAFEAWVGNAKVKELAREVRAIRRSAPLRGVGLRLFWDDPDQTGYWLRYHDVATGEP
jgi:hypothetical protein